MYDDVGKIGKRQMSHLVAADQINSHAFQLVGIRVKAMSSSLGRGIGKNYLAQVSLGTT